MKRNQTRSCKKRKKKEKEERAKPKETIVKIEYIYIKNLRNYYRTSRVL